MQPLEQNHNPRNPYYEGVSDTQCYKCIGNAVTVNVIQYIIPRIYNINT